MNITNSIENSKELQNKEIIARIANCNLCELHLSRNKTVPGEGPLDARIMIVGEGPGEQNDKTGRPFVGKGGAILDKYIVSAGLKREDIFLTNIIKCRMPHNATPSANIVSRCMEYLSEQIDIIQPKVIIALGLSAAKLLLKDNKLRLADLHDKTFNQGAYDIVCTYHPSYVRYNKLASQFIIETLIKAKYFTIQMR